MPLSNESVGLPRSSTIDEAVQLLGTRGLIWTRATFLSFLIKHEIPLHAVAPEHWPMSVEPEEYFNDKVGDFVYGPRRMRPANCLLAVLAPYEIETLLVRGEASTIRPAGEGGNQLAAIRFIKPVLVTFETVRVIDRTLQLILDLLQFDQPASPSPTVKASGNDWVVKARVRAREIIASENAQDRYPNQESVSDQIAAEFREARMVGVDRKPLSGATIKRHALRGITSAIEVLLPTQNDQSKRGSKR